LGSVIGILLGKLALNEIANSPERHSGIRMAKAGIFIGVLTLALACLATIAAVLFLAPIFVSG
jgi:hypothetical protein